MFSTVAVQNVSSLDQLARRLGLAPRERDLLLCMYRHTYYSKSMDQPGKVANPARGLLNRENECFPVRVRYVWSSHIAEYGSTG